MNGSPSVRVALFTRNGGSESPCRWFYVTEIYMIPINSPHGCLSKGTECLSPYYYLEQINILFFLHTIIPTSKLVVCSAPRRGMLSQAAAKAAVFLCRNKKTPAMQVKCTDFSVSIYKKHRSVILEASTNRVQTERRTLEMNNKANDTYSLAYTSLECHYHRRLSLHDCPCYLQ